jgi:hypothetical protein
VSAAFRAQSDAGAGVFETKAAPARGAVVPEDAVRGSVFTVVTDGPVFAFAPAGSDFSGAREAEAATGDDGADDLPGGLIGPLAGAVSVARAGAPRFGEALAGMIGGGIAARAWAGRVSA